MGFRRGAAWLQPFQSQVDCLHLCSHGWLSACSGGQSEVQALILQFPSRSKGMEFSFGKRGWEEGCSSHPALSMEKAYRRPILTKAPLPFISRRALFVSPLIWHQQEITFEFNPKALFKMLLLPGLPTRPLPQFSSGFTRGLLTISKAIKSRASPPNPIMIKASSFIIHLK